jgi:1-acyl-sn-glycerol-3-phosphate acyltransferase
VVTHSQFGLLLRQRFGPYLLTQSLLAFTDTLYARALVVPVVRQTRHLPEADTGALVILAAGLYVLPWLFVAAVLAQFGDRLDKAHLIRLATLLQIPIMLAAAAGFHLGSLGLLLAVLFALGARTALSEPLKYAILPQHLRQSELVGGDALTVSATFAAILLGTLAGALLFELPHGMELLSFTLAGVASLAWAASRAIPRAPPPGPVPRLNRNPFTELVRNLRALGGDRTLFLSVLGIGWFWFVAVIHFTQLPEFARANLGGGEQEAVVLLTLYTLGIATGALLCEWLSSHKVEIGLVPFGSIGLTLFTLDLFFAAPVAHLSREAMAGLAQTPANWRVPADVFLAGVSGGLFIVPLYALVQLRAEPAWRTRIFAGSIILNAAFMIMSGAMAIAILRTGLSIPQLFLATALLNALVAVYIYTLVPEYLMRFIVWILIHIAYRLRTTGLDNIPEQGAAVLVCNHVSYVDAVIIGGCVRRPVRFVIYNRIYHIPLLNFIFRTARAIPIAPAREDPMLVRRAYDKIDEALAAGEIVCIFPEGQITRDGELKPFRRGIERIIRTNPVPVIPMALCGLWGSFFSHRGGPAMRRLPRGSWSRIALRVGTPVAPGAVTITGLHDRVLALRGEWK